MIKVDPGERLNVADLPTPTTTSRRQMHHLTRIWVVERRSGPGQVLAVQLSYDTTAAVGVEIGALDGLLHAAARADTYEVTNAGVFIEYPTRAGSVGLSDSPSPSEPADD